MRLPSADDISREIEEEYNQYRCSSVAVRTEHEQARDQRVLKNYVHAYRHAVKTGKITKDSSLEDAHAAVVKALPAWVLYWLAKEVGFWLAKKLFTRLFMQSEEESIGAAPIKEES